MERETEGSGRRAREWKRKSRKVEEEGKESKGGGEISDGGMEEEGRKRLPKCAEAGHPLGVFTFKNRMLKQKVIIYEPKVIIFLPSLFIFTKD